ncbi:MAG TPA: SH3 domain-containing protein, partial [Acidimicrobiales bacterium]|nr:SH3 domain-containing protein [Acidimicrobiales bacterium]
APPTTAAPGSSTTAPASSTVPPGTQTSGSRTVLSPVGLNVRSAPSRTAAVVGSAAQGAVLTVTGYTAAGGGWFDVKGATVSGWISGQPTLSAPGEFRSFSSSQLSALYPAAWTEAPAASSVVFRPAAGEGDIVVSPAGNVEQLPHGRTGYGRSSVSSVVVCGTTAALVVFQRTAAATAVPGALAYRAEVRFAVDKQHALGFYADLPDLGPTFQTFKELLASVTFNAPQCVG